MHINLPFADDAEFGKLHAAVRLVLPLLPALAASSPVVEGRLTGFMDTRLEWTRHNQDKVPSLTGKVIPEPLYTRLDYQNRLLNGLYRDIAPLDPEKTLQNEWVNSRGAIARFDRNTIEIRVIDMQECPAADLAVASAVVEWIHLIVDETWYSSLFGFDAQSMTAGTFWKRLFNDHLRSRIQECFHAPLLHIIKKGPLARRIISALGDSFPVSRLQSLYRRLTECLQSGTLFE
jgi:hypothetical protein